MDASMDKDGNKIYRQFVANLEKLQEEEGLRLESKLKLTHI